MLLYILSFCLFYLSVYETVDYNPDDVIQQADDVTREVSEADSQSTYALDIHSLES